MKPMPTPLGVGCYHSYEDDGKTVWLIVPYKKGGSRAKPDEFPLGVCDVCMAKEYV